MWTPSDVERILVNPFYAITFSDTLFGEHPTLVSREQWITTNLRLIRDRCRAVAAPSARYAGNRRRDVAAVWLCLRRHR
jgi:hypothetical protein